MLDLLDFWRHKPGLLTGEKLDFLVLSFFACFLETKGLRSGRTNSDFSLLQEAEVE